MKLPDIQYGNAVRPLAKEDTTLPARRAQVGIELSRKQLDANLKVADSIGTSIRNLERSKLQTDITSIRDQANINIRQKSFDIQQDLNKSVLVANIASSFAQTGIHLIAQHYENKTRQQIADAKLGFAKGISDFQMANAGISHYDAKSLPEEVYKGNIEMDGPDSTRQDITVQRNQVFPELYKQKGLEIIEQQAKTIGSAELRKDFQQWAGTQLQESYISLVEDSIKNQQKEIVSQQSAVVDALIEEGRYSIGSKYLEDSLLPESDKIKLRSEIRVKSEKGLLSKVLLETDTESLAQAREYLTSRGYKGNLSAEDRLSWAGKVDTRIKDLTTQDEGVAKATKALATENIDNIIKLSATGRPVDYQQIDEAISQGERLGISPVKLETLRYVKQVQPKLRELAQAPYGKRQSIVQAFHSAAGTDPAKQLFAIEVEKRAIEIDKRLSDDPLQYAADSGVVQPLEPLQPSSPEFWFNRKQKQIMTENQYGVGGDLLTKQEAQQLSASFAEAPVDKQANLVKFWTAALGEESVQELFEQINLDVPTLPLLPNLDDTYASAALRGNRIRKENPAMIPPREAMITTYDNLLGDAYAGHAGMRAAAETLVTDLYLAEAERNGVFDGKTDFKPEMFEDQVWWGESVPFKNQLGLIKFNGRTLMAPAKGMTSTDFSQWIEGTSPKSLIGGRARGITDFQVIDGILEGNIVLQQEGKQEFILFETTTSTYIQDKITGLPLILNYSPATLPSRSMEEERNVE